MTSETFAQQIRKTGFVLENQIAQQLKAAKWTVISNRYYVDDAEESVREIDLVAYQATRVQHFDVYTALLISCKKSETNAWALLSRDIDLRDPNSDWQPLHAWSNDKALTYQLGRPESARNYHQAVTQLGVTETLRTPSVEVFAFQEMNRISGTPQNDKAIFNATTSLMKAQAYEMDALPRRRRTPAVYQFNLLSIVDSELVRLFFGQGGVIESQDIEHEHYIARYIIKKQATFARIRFLRAEAFAMLLPEYATLHKANCKWFDAECNAFYFDIVKDPARVETLISEFRKEIRWDVRWALLGKRLPAPDIEKLNFSWSDSDDRLRIFAPVDQDVAAALNADQKVREKIALALRKVYRYTGEFDFESDDIPF